MIELQKRLNCLAALEPPKLLSLSNYIETS